MNDRPEFLRWVICLVMIPGILSVSPATIFAQHNEADSEERAEESKIRILIVSGYPGWEYRILQRQMERDPAIVVSSWLQTLDANRAQEGNEPLDALPKTADELSRFDAIIMFDPNPVDFSKEWLINVQDFCRQGGGFLYVAGPKHSERFLMLDKSSLVRDVLPVELPEPDGDPVVSATGKMSIVTENQDHPVLKLVDDPNENLKIWNSMPSVYWSFPTSGKKANAVTLLQRADGNPLTVAGSYELGNVLFISHTGAWRWRRVGTQAQHHERFWQQVVGFLAQKGDR